VRHSRCASASRFELFLDSPMAIAVRLAEGRPTCCHRSMRALGSIVSLVIVLLIGLFVYRNYLTQSSSGGAVANPTQTIDVVGVKNDLIAIGQAERIYQVEHNSYASLDDLVSTGAMAMKKTSRDGYTYDVTTSADGFTVTAHCPAATSPGCSNLSLDQNMQVQATP
jgi:competence protein ComGC